MKKDKYISKGFTLIELLITLAIMGVVLQLIYSLFFVGNKSFNISKNRGFAQQNVRIASTFINDELRTAKNISSIELTGEHYSLSIKNEKLLREIHNGDGSKQNIYISNNLDNLNFKYVKMSNMKIINVNIEAIAGNTQRDDQSQSLIFDILLENPQNYDKEINQNIIYYSKHE